MVNTLQTLATVATTATTTISGWFLGLGLLFPRITLLVTYLMGKMPANESPLVLDMVLAFFFPRFLIAYYIYFNMGFQGLGAFLIVLFCFFEFAEKSSSSLTATTK